MSRIFLVAGLLFCCAPVPSAGQNHRAPTIGTRIRATPKARTEPYIMGNLISQSGDTITIQLPSPDSETVRLSLESLSMLEVSRGPGGNFSKGAVWGLLGGGAIGAVIGALAIEDPWRGVGAGLGFFTGGAAGILIGGSIGANIVTEHWKAAPGWELTFRVGRSQSGLGLSLRF